MQLFDALSGNTPLGQPPTAQAPSRATMLAQRPARPMNAVRPPDAPPAPAAPAGPPPAAQAVPQLAPVAGRPAPAAHPNLPVEGVKYAGDPAFAFPEGYGHASVKGDDGTTMFSYSSPAELSASVGHARAYEAQRLDDQRHGDLADIHSAIMAHLRGENGVYGGVDPESRAINVNALTNLYGNLNAADTTHHNLAQQQAVDPHRNPEYVAALANHLNAQASQQTAAAQLATAQADQAAHPERQLDLLDRLSNDPVKRAVYLSSKGVAPDVIAKLPQAAPQSPAGGGPAINVGNVNAQLETNPALSGLAEILDGTQPFHQKLAIAAQMPGFSNPESPERQTFNARMHQQFPTQQDWDKQLNSYPKYGPQELGGISGFPGIQTVGGTALSLISALSDPGALGSGYGWGGWDQNYQNGDLVRRLIDQHKITY